jgi:PAS domain S-box-containing protein
VILSFNSDNQKIRLEVESFIQSALDALSAHIAIINETGEIIGVNAAWRNFAVDNSFIQSSYGIGLNYLEVCDRSAQFGSSEAHDVALGLLDVIAGHIPEFEMEYPCHSPTEKRWFVVRASRFLWGNDIRVIVSHQNISELKATQMEVQESHERIQTVLDNIISAVFTVSPNGKIETCNPAAVRIFGYKREDFFDMSITDLISEPFNTVGTFRLFTGEQEHEVIGKRSSGGRFPMCFTLNSMMLNDGIFYTVIIQDLTKLKEMQAEIFEKDRISVALQKERELRDVKNRFLSMMSHELRTPLAAIRLSHDMIKRYGDRASEEEKEQYLDNINIQVEHLNEMVSDVLTLSKLERTEQGFTPKPTDLITYCRNIVEAFQINHYQTHNIEFECPDLTITAEFDKKLLRRALTNLISNAIKYSPSGGTVLFKLWQTETHASIQVIDSGIGIPTVDNDYMFSAFHRASNVGGLPGTGLGLAITKQIIDLHDGIINIESEVGIGTMFTIHLPLVVTRDSDST